MKSPAASSSHSPSEWEHQPLREANILDKIARSGVPELYQVKTEYLQEPQLEDLLGFPYREELRSIRHHFVLYLCSNLDELLEYLELQQIESQKIDNIPLEQVQQKVRRKIQDALRWRSPQQVTQVWVYNHSILEGSEEQKALQLQNR